MKKFYVILLSVIMVFLLFFINSIVGNPITKGLSTSYAKSFLETQFVKDTYTLTPKGFNYDTKLYDYEVKHTNGEITFTYNLFLKSNLANRKIDSFSLAPNETNEELSTRLSSEGQLHVTNIVRNLLPNAQVKYEVKVPKIYPENIVWTPGFYLDLNASIEIIATTELWTDSDTEALKPLLNQYLLNYGIAYSRLNILVTREYEKDGITKIQTVYKDEFFPNS